VRAKVPVAQPGPGTVAPHRPAAVRLARRTARRGIDLLRRTAERLRRAA
jgi:hypothetical protein